MRKSRFLKHIHTINEDELRDELMHLFDKIPEVKAFYALELGNDKDRQKIYDKAKESIKSKYRTKSYRKPRRPRIQKINSLLKELEKTAVFQWDMIDIYLFNAEQGLLFMNTYKFYSEPLKNTILNSLNKALLLIEESLFQDKYKERVETLISLKIYDFALRQELIHEIRKVYPD